MASWMENSVKFSKNTCLFCNEGNEELHLGQLYDLKVFSVHYLCVLTAQDLYANGNIDAKEGFYGFLLCDMYRAYKTFLNEVCTYCTKPGASLVCRKCNIKFHSPCGFRKGNVTQMQGGYFSYCKNCYNILYPPEKNLKDCMCVICHTIPEEEERLRLYWPVCCKPTEFIIDSDCLSIYAQTAGYLTKCPLCSNKNKFRRSIKQFGIFIPNSDAEWLADEDDKPITLPLRCSSTICIAKDTTAMTNVLISCVICEEQVAHMECTFAGIFLCKDCIQKLYPDAAFDESQSNFYVNEVFPWFFDIVESMGSRETVASIYGKVAEFLKRHVKDNGNKKITWHTILTSQESILLALRIKQYFRENCTVRKTVRATKLNQGEVAGPSSSME